MSTTGLTTLVKEYQTILKKKGLYNGDIDGQPGPLTVMASLSYHTDGKPEFAQARKWMGFAANELGVSELYGPKRNNPRIIHYHSYTGLAAQQDEVAWCASFVNCCLLEGSGIKGTGSAAAASFEKWGKKVSPLTFGAILTVRTNTGSKRHVFFNAGHHKDLILGLGGNQSNAVTVMMRDVDTIVESRFPL